MKEEKVGGRLDTEQNRKTVARTDQRLVSMADWGPGKIHQKIRKTPDHTITAQRKSHDHHDDKKTTQNTSRGAGDAEGLVLVFYLVGQ